MNAFLKILGIIFLILIAMKLAPFVLGPLFVVAGLLTLGLLACVAGLWAAGIALLALIAVLTPVWLPLALLVGFIMLIARLVRGPAAA